MKTIKFFSVLSLALIFIGVTAGFSKKSETLTSQSQTSSGIFYQVIIHPEFNSGPCGNYVIKVLNETGLPVAPAQYYVPGLNKYSFTEMITGVQNAKGKRVAVLEQVIIPDCPQCVCANPLFALPDVKIGPFLVGQTYTFNLYPKNVPQTTD